MVNMQTGLMATTPVTSTTENQLTQVWGVCNLRIESHLNHMQL